MFSLQKIAVLIGIISAVWAAFRLIGQVQQAQKERQRMAHKEAKSQQQKNASSKANTKQENAKAVELAACPRCGSFVPNGKHIC